MADNSMDVSDSRIVFERMFRAHHAAVHRYVMRRVEEPAVADLVAETFLVAWRRRGEIAGDPLPWLLGVARRVCANHLRSRHRRAALNKRLAAEPAPPAHSEVARLFGPGPARGSGRAERARLRGPAAQVATPVHVDLARVRGHYAIRVTSRPGSPSPERAAPTRCSRTTSSPFPSFEETQRDIRVGQTITWELIAPRPGVYSGKVVLGEGTAPPYLAYGYSPGPVVGRFRIRVP